VRKVLTNGSFDFFHYGHLCLLNEARELGDSLTVLVDTDERIDAIKSGRRITCLQERVDFLMALRCVDAVGFIHSDANFMKQLWDMKPTVYVKGGEYDRGTLKPLGVNKLLDAMGTEVVFLPMVETRTRQIIGLARSFKEVFNEPS